jgi:hypothetical protein
MIGHRSVRRRAAVLGAALVLALASVPLVASTALAAPTPLGKNLVRNPGAEAGPGTDGYSTVAIPDWQLGGNFTVVRYGSPGFPTKAESDRIGGGKKFFSCGPATASSLAQQFRKIKGRGALIDARLMRIKVRVRLAGYLNGTDSGRLGVHFADADGFEIQTSWIGLDAGTNGVFKLGKLDRIVPVGTRLMVFGMIGERANDGGSYCDVYFDKVSVVLEQVD